MKARERFLDGFPEHGSTTAGNGSRYVSDCYSHRLQTADPTLALFQTSLSASYYAKFCAAYENIPNRYRFITKSFPKEGNSNGLLLIVSIADDVSFSYGKKIIYSVELQESGQWPVDNVHNTLLCN